MLVHQLNAQVSHQYDFHPISFSLVTLCQDSAIYSNFLKDSAVEYCQYLFINSSFVVLWIHRIPHQVDGEEWLGYPWSVPTRYQGSPSVCCQYPWRINTNVSSVSRSWGSLSRLSVATASVYTASSSSPGRLVVLRPPTTVWNAIPSPANAHSLIGHASAHPVLLFLLTSGNSWHPRSITQCRLILQMTGL